MQPRNPTVPLLPQPIENVFLEVAMDWNRIEGNLKQMKGKLREKWGRLTDDELDKMAGEREKLVGTLQEQYGLSPEQAEERIERWERQFPDGPNQPRHH